MAQMINTGKELIRICPKDARCIEYSVSGGRRWFLRYFGNTIGEFLDLADTGNEILATTSKGLYYSDTAGKSWFEKSPNNSERSQACFRNNVLVAFCENTIMYNKVKLWLESTDQEIPQELSSTISRIETTEIFNKKLFMLKQVSERKNEFVKADQFCEASEARDTEKKRISEIAKVVFEQYKTTDTEYNCFEYLYFENRVVLVFSKSEPAPYLLPTLRVAWKDIILK